MIEWLRATNSFWESGGNNSTELCFLTMAVGKITSKKERQVKNLNSQNLTYGEVEYSSIAEIFELIKEEHDAFLKPGGVFVDLGSGIGKGVLAGALAHEFEE